jgi:hypothetical protein
VIVGLMKTYSACKGFQAGPGLGGAGGGVNSRRVNARADDALQDFQSHCEGVLGVRAVRLGTDDDEPCLVVMSGH